MKKQQIKYIKEIANRLPTVYEQTISGFYEDYNEQGELQRFPNVVTKEINHVRRMRKAYDSLGMDGIKQYLEMIHKLQIQRNELLRQSDPEGQKEEMDDFGVGATDQPGIDSTGVEVPVQDQV